MRPATLIVMIILLGGVMLLLSLAARKAEDLDRRGSDTKRTLEQAKGDLAIRDHRISELERIRDGMRQRHSQEIAQRDARIAALSASLAAMIAYSASASPLPQTATNAAERF